MIASGRVVLLGGAGEATNIVFHALEGAFDLQRVIIEASVSRRDLLKRRVRRLGVSTVLGQVAFLATVAPILGRRSQARIADIDHHFGLDRSSIPSSRIVRVASVNDAQTRAVLSAEKPDVVVIQGTRLLAKELLTELSCPVINMHAGITPAYRGVHGAYWALTRKDSAHCGVTVHLVDAGIDTGSVIAQATISPTPKDNYATYPHLQLATGLPLLRAAVKSALDGTLATQTSPTPDSRLWSHPTLFEYAWHRVINGIR